MKKFGSFQAFRLLYALSLYLWNWTESYTILIVKVHVENSFGVKEGSLHFLLIHLACIGACETFTSSVAVLCQIFLPTLSDYFLKHGDWLSILPAIVEYLSPQHIGILLWQGSLTLRQDIWSVEEWVHFFNVLTCFRKHQSKIQHALQEVAGILWLIITPFCHWSEIFLCLNVISSLVA